MPVHLTANAISAIHAGDLNAKPLVQVLDIKARTIANQERYRLVISDGELTQDAMIATQLNDRVKTGQIVTGSVVQLIDYVCNSVHSRKYVVHFSLALISPR
uniref:Replication factor-A protein 1 N-terminal domain-containing protein n=1 Tax=Daucus carota subsp. sativus TaxID=79200 RepID=A0A175YL13_DAUCS